MEWTPIVDRVYSATFDVGDESGGNEIIISIQLKDFAGNDMKVPSCVFAYMSNDSDGADIIETTYDGTISSGTDGEYIVGATDGVDMHLISESDGDIDLSITEDTSTQTSYLVVVLPNGKLSVSGAIVFSGS